MAYDLGNGRNISEIIDAALIRKRHLKETDVTGGTTSGSHEKNSDERLEGRRMAGGLWLNKGAEGEFAQMTRDPANKPYLDYWMSGFVNGGFNDDILPPPPPPPVKGDVA